jgi:hypothetical protein
MPEVDRRTAYSTPDDDLPPLPDDPRVPTLSDADPVVSKELGGAAPAIGSASPAPK